MSIRGRMPWFRVHAEARTDAKLESLPDDEFRVWFRLLCLASEQPERGVIAGYSVRLLAVEVARCDVALLGRTLASLMELRIIECDQETDSTRFIHWMERQYDKESDWPENTRSRKAEQRSRDVTPTHARSRDVTRCHAIEREREREVLSDGEDISGERMPAPARSLGALALSPSPSSVASVSPAPSPTAPSPPKLVALPSSPSAPPVTPAATRKPRAPDPLWDACVLICDGNGKGPANDAERGKWNKGLKSLRQSGATAEEITIRAERYRRRYGEEIALNPLALANNWSTLSREMTEVSDHADSSNTHSSSNTANHSNGARFNNRGRGGSSQSYNSYNSYTGPHLPDADEWREWARKEREAGRPVIGG